LNYWHKAWNWTIHFEAQNRTPEAAEHWERTWDEQNSYESSHTVDKHKCPNNQTHDNNVQNQSDSNSMKYIKLEPNWILFQSKCQKLNLNLTTQKQFTMNLEIYCSEFKIRQNKRKKKKKRKKEMLLYYPMLYAVCPLLHLRPSIW